MATQTDCAALHDAGSMRAGIFITLAVAAALGCGQDPQVTLLLPEIPAGVSSLAITPSLRANDSLLFKSLGDKRASERLDQVVLEFDPGTTGQLQIEVIGLNDGQCKIAQAPPVQLQIDPATSAEQIIQLALLPAQRQGCGLDLTQSGDGTITCAWRSSGSDAWITGPCDAPHALATPVQLIPQANAGSYFLGFAGACLGVDPCELSLQNERQSVGATFLPLHACTAPPGQARFCWENPLPQGNLIGGLAVLSPDDAWATGDNGTILHWNGQFWAPVPSNLSPPVLLSTVWAGGGEIFVGGSRGAILRWNGTSFDQVNQGADRRAINQIYGIVPPAGAADPRPDVWAVGLGNLVLHWSYGSQSFQEVQLPLGLKVNLSGIWGARADDLWLVGDAGTVLRYDGSHFSLVQSGTPFDLHSLWGRTRPGQPDQVFIGGGEPGLADVPPKPLLGVVLIWDGTAFTQQNRPSPVISVWGTPEGPVWSVTLFNISYQSTINSQIARLALDGNEAQGNWVTVPRPSGAGVPWLYNVAGSSQADIWIAGEGGTLWHWNASFLRSTEGGTLANLNAVWANGSDSVWAAGDGGTMLHRVGDSWLPVDSTTTSDLLALWGEPALAGRREGLWAIGMDGAIRRWNGQHFSSVELLTDPLPTLNAVWGTSAGDVYIAGTNGEAGNVGRIFHAQRGSMTIDEVTIPTIMGGLRGIWADDGGDVWAVGRGGAVLREHGGIWEVVPMPSNFGVDLSSVWGSGPDDVWICGENGATFDKPTVLLHWRGQNLESVLMQAPGYRFTRLWGGGPGDLWALGIDGQRVGSIVHSDGTSFRAFPGTDGVGSAIAGHGTDVVFVVGVAGQILRLSQ